MTIVIDPDIAAPSGETLDDIVAKVRRKLSDKVNLNTLAGDLDETDTVVTFGHELHSVVRGTLISIDNEIMYVWSVDEASRSVTVERGQGSPVEPHVSGTKVYIGGKSRLDIVDAINNELTSLSASGLYQMKSYLASNPITGLISVADLGGSDIYDVQIRQRGTIATWDSLPTWRHSAMDGTIGLDRAYGTLGTDFRVLFKAGFNRLIDGADDVQVASGLHAEAADILVWGACISLISPDEYIRNDFRTQGDTRRANEVPYRAASLSIRDFEKKRDQRLTEEKDRLRRSYPLRKVGW